MKRVLVESASYDDNDFVQYFVDRSKPRVLKSLREYSIGAFVFLIFSVLEFFIRGTNVKSQRHTGLLVQTFMFLSMFITGSITYGFLRQNMATMAWPGLQIIIITQTVISVGSSVIALGVLAYQWGPHFDENADFVFYFEIEILMLSVISPMWRAPFKLHMYLTLFLGIILSGPAVFSTTNHFDIAGGLIIIMVFVVVFNYHSYTQDRAIRKGYALKVQSTREQLQVNEVLQRMIPASIIPKLLSNDPCIFDQHDQVSILFSQINKFDQLTNSLEPVQLVQYLNHLFSQFDTLTELHVCYKVETIGSVYLVVSGCPEQFKTEHHALAVSSLALDMRLILGACQIPGYGEIEVQMGIHTGSVIAGIVGEKYPRFRLMGDTVNIASRMSTTCEGSDIQLSSTTAACLLQSDEAFELQARGVVQVKGIGEMKTHLLNFGPCCLAVGGRRLMRKSRLFSSIYAAVNEILRFDDEAVIIEEEEEEEPTNSSENEERSRSISKPVPYTPKNRTVPPESPGFGSEAPRLALDSPGLTRANTTENDSNHSRHSSLGEVRNGDGSDFRDGVIGKNHDEGGFPGQEIDLEVLLSDDEEFELGPRQENHDAKTPTMSMNVRESRMRTLSMGNSVMMAAITEAGSPTSDVNDLQRSISTGGARVSLTLDLDMVDDAHSASDRSDTTTPRNVQTPRTPRGNIKPAKAPLLMSPMLADSGIRTSIQQRNRRMSMTGAETMPTIKTESVNIDEIKAEKEKQEAALAEKITKRSRRYSVQLDRQVSSKNVNDNKKSAQKRRGSILSNRAEDTANGQRSPMNRSPKNGRRSPRGRSPKSGRRSPLPQGSQEDRISPKSSDALVKSPSLTGMASDFISRVKEKSSPSKTTRALPPRSKSPTAPRSAQHNNTVRKRARSSDIGGDSKRHSRSSTMPSLPPVVATSKVDVKKFKAFSSEHKRNTSIFTDVERFNSFATKADMSPGVMHMMSIKVEPPMGVATIQEHPHALETYNSSHSDGSPRVATVSLRETPTNRSHAPTPGSVTPSLPVPGLPQTDLSWESSPNASHSVTQSHTRENSRPVSPSGVPVIDGINIHFGDEFQDIEPVAGEFDHKGGTDDSFHEEIDEGNWIETTFINHYLDKYCRKIRRMLWVVLTVSTLLSAYDLLYMPNMTWFWGLLTMKAFVALVGAIGLWTTSRHVQHTFRMATAMYCLVTVSIVVSWMMGDYSEIERQNGEIYLVGEIMLLLIVVCTRSYLPYEYSRFAVYWIMACFGMVPIRDHFVHQNEGTLLLNSWLRLGVASGMAAMYLRISRRFVHHTKDDFIVNSNRRYEFEILSEFVNNLLPPVIMRELTSVKNSIVVHERTHASIMYTDIVGFTAMCARIPAEEVVAVLNAVFSKFDEITSSFGVFKVETIGDAYLCCTGVVNYNDAKTEDTSINEEEYGCAAALDLINCALTFQVALSSFVLDDGSEVRIRAGIHSGPVIAGVVGINMPRYHLFGTTCTIAEEVEHTGVAGSVVVTETTQSQVMKLDPVLTQHYNFTERDMKINDDLKCYVVTASGQMSLLLCGETNDLSTKGLLKATISTPSMSVRLTPPRHASPPLKRTRRPAAHRRRRRGNQYRTSSMHDIELEKLGGQKQTLPKGRLHNRSGSLISSRNGSASATPDPYYRTMPSLKSPFGMMTPMSFSRAVSNDSSPVLLSRQNSNPMFDEHERRFSLELKEEETFYDDPLEKLHKEQTFMSLQNQSEEKDEIRISDPQRASETLNRIKQFSFSHDDMEKSLSGQGLHQSFTAVAQELEEEDGSVVLDTSFSMNESQ